MIFLGILRQGMQLALKLDVDAYTSSSVAEEDMIIWSSVYRNSYQQFWDD